MVDTATPRLRLNPPTVGGDYNTWGNTLNNDLSILDDAITGSLWIDLSGLTTLTLTTANGATDQARYAQLLFTGSNSAAETCTVTLPANQKLYWIRNTCTNTTVVLQVSSSGSSVSIPSNNLFYKVFCDGTNVVILSLAAQSVSDWTSMQAVPASDADARYAKGTDLTTLQTTVASNTAAISTNASAINTETSARASGDAALQTAVNSKVAAQGGTADTLTVTTSLRVNYGSNHIQFQDDGNAVIYDGSGNVIFTVSGSSIAWNGKGFAFQSDLPIDASERIQAFNVSVASLATVSFPEAFSDTPTCIIIIGRTNNGRAMTASYDDETPTNFVLQAQREDTDGASQQTTAWTFSILAVGPK